MVYCGYCGKEFTPSPYQKRQYKAGKLIYCSKTCGNLHRYSNLQEVTEVKLNKIKDLIQNTNVTLEEIQKESGLSESVFKRVLDEYNLHRSKETINELRITKMQQTVKSKYGVDNVMELSEFRDKIAETYNNKSTDEKAIITDKIKSTKLERYGNENYNNMDKIQSTNMEKYGVNSGYLTEYGKQRHKEVSLELYGVDNPLKSKEIHIKSQNAIHKKYGVTSVMKLKSIQDKAKNTMLKKYGVDNVMKSSKYQSKMKTTMFDKYGVISGFMTENAINSHKHGTISKINREFAESLREITTSNVKLEEPILKYLYDIRVGENYLIDINPTVSHNTLISYPYRLGMTDKNHPIDKTYHLDRLYTANKHGYKLISIFDWDDVEKIKYIFQDKSVIYARNLNIKEVSVNEANEFLNKYHLQNMCRGQSVRYGLYKDNELIEIMTFGKPRYNKNYEWELMRLCTHKDYKIVGGAEKLFKYFVKNYMPKSIISYCDLSKFSGDIYIKLKFKRIGKISPSKHWSKNNEHITDNLLRQRGYDQLFNTDYGKGTSNEELMVKNGWLPVYDCGQATYLWENK